MTTYSYAQLQQLWVNNGGNPATAAMAAAIALAESGGNPNAAPVNSNGSTDRGLWQINSVHGAQSTFDPNANAAAAVAISGNGTNWRPWCTAYSDGACGSKGGTFLGAGSPFMRFLAGGTPPQAGGAVPLPGTAQATLTAAGASSDCLVQIPGVLPSWVPLIGGSPGCLISRSTGESLKGVACIIAGGILVLYGVSILVKGDTGINALASALKRQQAAPQGETAEQKYFRENAETEAENARSQQAAEQGQTAADFTRGKREAKVGRKLGVVRDAEAVAA